MELFLINRYRIQNRYGLKFSHMNIIFMMKMEINCMYRVVNIHREMENIMIRTMFLLCRLGIMLLSMEDYKTSRKNYSR
jgi:hypothetical protein